MIFDIESGYRFFFKIKFDKINKGIVMITKRLNVGRCVCVALVFALFFALNGYAGDENVPTEKAIKCAGTVSTSDSITNHSDSNTVGSLAKVIKQIGAGFGTIELQGPKTYVLKNDLTIPKKVIIKFQSGAVLFVEKDCTLKFDGVIDAGLQQIFDGPGHIKGKPKVSAVVPQWFGAEGDGIADDTVSLQKAVDFACTSQILAVDLNIGWYRITKTLDCTNIRQPSMPRDGLNIYGSSFLNTQIIGDTGDNTAVMDISGVEWLQLNNFMITSSKNDVTGGVRGNNPSTVGIFVGCGKVLPQSSQQRCHVFIGMQDDMKANGGKGTIGLWNFASEENTYDSVTIIANRPVVLTALNSSSCDWEYKNSYVEQMSVHSIGMTTFSGETCLIAMGAPAFTTVCAYSLSIQNGYIQMRNAKNVPVFDVSGSLMNLTFSGTVEGGGRLFRINNGGKWIDGSQMRGEMFGSNISCVFGVLADKNEPIIELASGGKIINSDIKINCSGEPGLENRNLFAVIEDKDAKYTGGIFNTTIKTNQPSKWIQVPEIIKKNCKQTTISNNESYTDLAFPPLAK